MMLTLLPIVLALSQQPAMTVAYLTPEEVLLQEQMQNFDGYTSYTPPNTRRARATGDEVAAERLLQHPSTLQPLGGTPAEASSSSASSAPAASVTDAASSEHGAAVSPFTLDPTTLRLLQRIERNNVRANSLLEAQDRPLTPTGPAGYATVAVMLLAVGWTVWKAKKGKGWNVR